MAGKVISKIVRCNGTLEIQKGDQRWSINASLQDNGKLSTDLINAVITDEADRALVAMFSDVFGGCAGVIIRELQDEDDRSGHGGSGRQGV